MSKAKEKQIKAQEREEFRIRFNLPGLVFFSMSLIAATGVLVFVLERPSREASIQPAALVASVSSGSDADKPFGPDKPPKETPPWGELFTQNVRIDLPEEYVLLEEGDNKVYPWVFDGMNLQQACYLMSSCGLTTQQVAHAISPPLASVTDTNVIVQPDEELIFSLSADARAKLYSELGKNPANRMMQSPIMFKNSFVKTIGGVQLDEKIVSTVKSLLYERNGVECLSDYGSLMRRVPFDEQRRRLIEALFNQSTVIARLRIRPTTDVDKLLIYWCGSPNGCAVGLRPLLESIKRLPDGGGVNLINFLPQFARERLYTFPLPAQPGDPTMDCHWSTLNFINNTSEGHFIEGKDISYYVATNCVQVAKPTHYGDLIFLTDNKNHPIHSAVYIADDLVFTKDGDDFRQPWTLKRIDDMVRLYSALGATHVSFWRKKDA
jgi:hypothetical protein